MVLRKIEGNTYAPEVPAGNAILHGQTILTVGERGLGVDDKALSHKVQERNRVLACHSRQSIMNESCDATKCHDMPLQKFEPSICRVRSLRNRWLSTRSPTPTTVPPFVKKTGKRHGTTYPVGHGVDSRGRNKFRKELRRWEDVVGQETPNLVCKKTVYHRCPNRHVTLLSCIPRIAAAPKISAACHMQAFCCAIVAFPQELDPVRYSSPLSDP